MFKETTTILNDASKKKLNFGCGLDVRRADQGWVNMDGIDHEGIVRADIFALPLPFGDDTFDLVLAKHVLEHVPHNVPAHGYKQNFLQLLMEDIWRILRPGGLLHVEVPHGISALLDAIDHKRTVTPNTFHIFYPNNPWNFYSDCRFEHVAGERRVGWSYRALRSCMRRFLDVDIEPLRIRPGEFTLRKLPRRGLS